MLVYPQFNPVALQLGPIAIHWYGLTYLAAFGLFVWLGAQRVKLAQFAQAGWTRRDIEDLLFYGVLGVVIGGRLGYVLFYKPGYYAAHPLEVFAVWKGGMAFHGGLLGVLVAMAVFARMRGRRFLAVTDLIAPCVPTGLACGRIAAAATPPVVAVPVPARRAAAVRRAVVLRQETARAGPGVGRVSDWLRRAAFHRRILPRAR
jgi:phosphatidylglycerol---prolipoprotein diacylglyceryl transferase